MGQKVFGYESILVLCAPGHLSLAFLLISGLSSHKMPSPELGKRLPGASVKEGLTRVQFAFGSPPVFPVMSVSHDALWGELGKLVCVFLWASSSVSLIVSENH